MINKILNIIYFISKLGVFILILIDILTENINISTMFYLGSLLLDELQKIRRSWSADRNIIVNIIDVDKPKNKRGRPRKNK